MYFIESFPMDTPERCRELRELYDKFSRIRRDINAEHCKKLDMLHPHFDDQVKFRTLDLERKYESVVIAGVNFFFVFLFSLIL